MVYKYYLGLGSNIDPKFDYLCKAIDELNQIGQVKKKSSIYDSSPWGEKKQNNFINAIVRFYTHLNPFELLIKLKNIEKKIGRKLNSIKWGPREIDIDILFTDHISINKDFLTIPHKHFSERNFVLEPMTELNKNYKPEDFSNSIYTYLKKSKDLNPVKKIIENW